MLEFPDWSDLGKGRISGLTQDIWATEMGLLQRYEHYYSGAVFQEYAEKEKPTDEDIPLFPAGINLAKIFCTTLSDAMFGEWDDVPVKFESTRSEDKASDLKAIELAHDIMREGGCGASFWEAEMDRNKFGGGALRIAPIGVYPFIRWSRVHRDAFFPIWDPEDPNEILEAWAISILSPEQVKLKFNVSNILDQNIYAEHWTTQSYETFLNTQQLQQPKINPYKVVPFAYSPRVRTSYWWGDSLIEDIISIQDELNMSIGDAGEVIRKNAHPIVTGHDIPAGFSKDVYRSNSDALWDLGRTQGDRVPGVDVLEMKGDILEPAFNYIRFMLRMGRDQACTPAIAYGDDDGGGQRSGDTLEIRLNPLMASVRRSRSYFTPAARRMLKITAAILRQKNFSGIQARTIDSLEKLTPTYSSVLPRSRPAIVDEVVKLLSTDPPSISLETAEVILGRGSREVEQIKEMIKDKALQKEKPIDQTGLPDGQTLPVSGREGKAGGAKDNSGR
jgi:hypothetical protein